MSASVKKLNHIFPSRFHTTVYILYYFHCIPSHDYLIPACTPLTAAILHFSSSSSPPCLLGLPALSPPPPILRHLFRAAGKRPIRKKNFNLYSHMRRAYTQTHSYAHKSYAGCIFFQIHFQMSTY